MKCPDCNSRTKTVDSRLKGYFVRRKRRCLECSEEFITHEIMANSERAKRLEREMKMIAVIARRALKGESK